MSREYTKREIGLATVIAIAMEKTPMRQDGKGEIGITNEALPEEGGDGRQDEKPDNS